MLNSAPFAAPAQCRGFSLVELVTIIVLLGILAATVAPRFIGRDSFSDYAVRDQLMAAARIAQQRAMYDQGSCYRLRVSAGVLTAEGNRSGSYHTVGATEDWQNGVNVTGVSDLTVYFSGLGSPLDNTVDCTGSLSEVDIPISGSNNLGVCLHASGYIEAARC